MSISGAARSSVVRNIETDEVLWKWNGVNTSQFDLPITGTGLTAPGGTLSVEAFPAGIDTTPNRNRLKYALGSGESTVAIFPINDLPPMPDRFVVEFTIGPRESGSLGANMIPGMCLFQDGDHVFRIERGTGGTSIQVHCHDNNNGYALGAQQTQSSIINPQAGTLYRAFVDLRDPDTGVDPELNMRVEADYNLSLNCFATALGWSTFGGGTAPWDVSWQSGGTLKKIGAVFVDLGIGEGYIADMRILRHPADLANLDISTALGRRVSQALSDEQTGTTPKNVGAFYLPAGTLKQTSKVLMGTTTAAPDEATLELRRESDASLIATWTKQGPLDSTELSADAAIPAPGWYYFDLYADSGGVVAQIKGIELEVV